MPTPAPSRADGIRKQYFLLGRKRPFLLGPSSPFDGVGQGAQQWLLGERSLRPDPYSKEEAGEMARRRQLRARKARGGSY